MYCMAQNFDSWKFDESGLGKYWQVKIDEYQCADFVIFIVMLTMCTHVTLLYISIAM